MMFLKYISFVRFKTDMLLVLSRSLSALSRHAPPPSSSLYAYTTAVHQYGGTSAAIGALLVLMQLPMSLPLWSIRLKHLRPVGTSFSSAFTLVSAFPSRCSSGTRRMQKIWRTRHQRSLVHGVYGYNHRRSDTLQCSSLVVVVSCGRGWLHCVSVHA